MLLAYLLAVAAVAVLAAVWSLWALAGLPLALAGVAWLLVRSTPGPAPESRPVYRSEELW